MPYTPLTASVFILITSLLILYIILTRYPKPNVADYMLVITTAVRIFAMIINIGKTLDMEQQSRDFYVEEIMIDNLIFIPAYVAGISIFLLTSYMIDSNRELARLAMIDPLTGLLNRRALFSEMSKCSKKLESSDETDFVILADIDLFKRINDTYGHEAGDIAIKKFADLIQDNTRDGDILSRYGGEEFLVLLPDIDEESALGIAERIREKCEAMSFTYKGDVVSFTASFGISQLQLDKDSDTTIVEADRALYIAKTSGRNQVINSHNCQ